MFGRSVRTSAELKRILALPERDPLALGERLVNGMTKRLRLPEGKHKLKPLQALALAEAGDYGYGVGPLPVGSGKTWLSFLLPVVLEAKAPLLLMPSAHEREKFQAEWADFKRHWKHHPKMRTLGYGALSKPGKKNVLFDLTPDVLVADEAHCLGDLKSLRTARVLEYGKWCAKNGKPFVFIPLSGTMYTRTYRRFWHLQQWALPPELQLLPQTWIEMESWANALDSKVYPYRIPLGALTAFGESLDKARQGYGRRLERTPGVWLSRTQDTPASLRVRLLDADFTEIKKESARLNTDWQMLSGELIESSAIMWSKQRQVGNGFFYRPAESPPPRWRARRSDWVRFVAEYRARKRRPLSPSMVAEECPDAPELLRWLEVRDTFKPSTEAYWFSRQVLDWAHAWMQQHKGFVWVEHLEVGRELSKLTGAPFYAEEGLTLDGQSIVHHKNGAAIGSMAVAEGFNLQKAFGHCLILNAPPNGAVRQQMLGRFHRTGQERDEVLVDVLVAVPTQLGDHVQAMKDAERDHAMGSPQKLMLASIEQTKAKKVS